MLWHFIQARKRTGPSTLPRGTLGVSTASSDHSPYTTTFWDLFFRKSLIQSRHGPFMLWYWNFLRRCCVRPHWKLCWNSWWLGHTASHLPLPAITYQQMSVVVFCRSALLWSHVGSKLTSYGLPGVGLFIYLWCAQTFYSRGTAVILVYSFLHCLPSWRWVLQEQSSTSEGF